ncbi:MAG: OadG family protein [Clostridia bacterium]|nr:OadG family protein [Clostridia bacterium]
MAFIKINGFLNSAMVAMSDTRGLNEILKMLQQDPESIKLLTTSEKVLMILFVAGLGMAVTFSVLVFLWFSISMVSNIFKAMDKKTVKPSKVEKVETTTAVVDEYTAEDDEELIAVIAAAVAASMNTSIHNIVVKNIVRTNDHTPSWAKTGRIEQMNTRF